MDGDTELKKPKIGSPTLRSQNPKRQTLVLSHVTMVASPSEQTMVAQPIARRRNGSVSSGKGKISHVVTLPIPKLPNQRDSEIQEETVPAEDPSKLNSQEGYGAVVVIPARKKVSDSDAKEVGSSGNNGTVSNDVAESISFLPSSAPLGPGLYRGATTTGGAGFSGSAPSSASTSSLPSVEFSKERSNSGSQRKHFLRTRGFSGSEDSMEKLASQGSSEKGQKEKEQWKTCVDPKSGLSFFYNPETGCTRWSMPKPLSAEQLEQKEEKEEKKLIESDEEKRKIDVDEEGSWVVSSESDCTQLGKALFCDDIKEASKLYQEVKEKQSFVPRKGLLGIGVSDWIAEEPALYASTCTFNSPDLLKSFESVVPRPPDLPASSRQEERRKRTLDTRYVMVGVSLSNQKLIRDDEDSRLQYVFKVSLWNKSTRLTEDVPISFDSCAPGNYMWCAFGPFSVPLECVIVRVSYFKKFCRASTAVMVLFDRGGVKTKEPENLTVDGGYEGADPYTLLAMKAGKMHRVHVNVDEQEPRAIDTFIEIKEKMVGVSLQVMALSQIPNPNDLKLTVSRELLLNNQDFFFKQKARNCIYLSPMLDIFEQNTRSVEGLTIAQEYCIKAFVISKGKLMAGPVVVAEQNKSRIQGAHSAFSAEMIPLHPCVFEDSQAYVILVFESKNLEALLASDKKKKTLAITSDGTEGPVVFAYTYFRLFTEPGIPRTSSIQRSGVILSCQVFGGAPQMAMDPKTKETYPFIQSLSTDIRATSKPLLRTASFVGDKTISNIAVTNIPVLFSCIPSALYSRTEIFLNLSQKDAIAKVEVSCDKETIARYLSLIPRPAIVPLLKSFFKSLFREEEDDDDDDDDTDTEATSDSETATDPITDAASGSLSESGSGLAGEGSVSDAGKASCSRKGDSGRSHGSSRAVRKPKINKEIVEKVLGIEQLLLAFIVDFDVLSTESSFGLAKSIIFDLIPNNYISGIVSAYSNIILNTDSDQVILFAAVYAKAALLRKEFKGQNEAIDEFFAALYKKVSSSSDPKILSTLLIAFTIMYPSFLIDLPPTRFSKHYGELLLKLRDLLSSDTVAYSDIICNSLLRAFQTLPDKERQEDESKFHQLIYPHASCVLRRLLELFPGNKKVHSTACAFLRCFSSAVCASETPELLFGYAMRVAMPLALNFSPDNIECGLSLLEIMSFINKYSRVFRIYVATELKSVPDTGAIINKLAYSWKMILDYQLFVSQNKEFPTKPLSSTVTTMVSVTNTLIDALVSENEGAWAFVESDGIPHFSLLLLVTTILDPSTLAYGCLNDEMNAMALESCRKVIESMVTLELPLSSDISCYAITPLLRFLSLDSSPDSSSPPCELVLKCIASVAFCEWISSESIAGLLSASNCWLASVLFGMENPERLDRTRIIAENVYRSTQEFRKDLTPRDATAFLRCMTSFVVHVFSLCSTYSFAVGKGKTSFTVWQMILRCFLFRALDVISITAVDYAALCAVTKCIEAAERTHEHDIVARLHILACDLSWDMSAFSHKGLYFISSSTLVSQKRLHSPSSRTAMMSGTGAILDGHYLMRSLAALLYVQDTMTAMTLTNRLLHDCLITHSQHQSLSHWLKLQSTPSNPPQFFFLRFDGYKLPPHIDGGLFIVYLSPDRPHLNLISKIRSSFGDDITIIFGSSLQSPVFRPAKSVCVSRTWPTAEVDRWANRIRTYSPNFCPASITHSPTTQTFSLFLPIYRQIKQLPVSKFVVEDESTESDTDEHTSTSAATKSAEKSDERSKKASQMSLVRDGDRRSDSSNEASFPSKDDSSNSPSTPQTQSPTATLSPSGLSKKNRFSMLGASSITVEVNQIPVSPTPQISDLRSSKSPTKTRTVRTLSASCRAECMRSSPSVNLMETLKSVRETTTNMPESGGNASGSETKTYSRQDVRVVTPNKATMDGEHLDQITRGYEFTLDDSVISIPDDIIKEVDIPPLYPGLMRVDASVENALPGPLWMSRVVNWSFCEVSPVDSCTGWVSLLCTKMLHFFSNIKGILGDESMAKGVRCSSCSHFISSGAFQTFDDRVPSILHTTNLDQIAMEVLGKVESRDDPVLCDIILSLSKICRGAATSTPLHALRVLRNFLHEVLCENTEGLPSVHGCAQVVVSETIRLKLVRNKVEAYLRKRFIREQKERKILAAVSHRASWRRSQQAPKMPDYSKLKIKDLDHVERLRAWLEQLRLTLKYAFIVLDRLSDLAGEETYAEHLSYELKAIQAFAPLEELQKKK